MRQREASRNPTTPDLIPEAPTVPWRRICREVIFSRLILAAVALLARLAIRPGPHDEPTKQGVLQIFFQWDSGWFLSIVNQGYFYDPAKQSSVAFFPLYPALVWALSLGRTLDPVAVGFALSLTCQAIACCMLWRITMRHLRNEATATLSYRLMLLFPTAFFASIFYSEGLFLCLLTLCLDASDRKAWWEAALWGAALSLTRSVGIVAVLPVALSAIGFSGNSRRVTIDWGAAKAMLGTMAGLGLYCGYLWWAYGDPIAFLTVQKNWGRTLASPLLPFVDGFHNNGTPLFQRILHRWSLYGFGLVTAYGLWTRVPLRWISLLIALPLIFVSTTVLDSIPRYLSTVCTAFPILAHAGIRWPMLGAGLVLLLAMLQALCVILFTNGYFFI